MKVLAVGAHPDDIELGCAGALRAHVLAGERDVARLEMEIQLITENNPLNLVFDVRLGNS